MPDTDLNDNLVKRVAENSAFRETAGFVEGKDDFDYKMVQKFMETHGGSFSKIQKNLEKANKYTHKIYIQHPNMGCAPIAC